MLLPIFCDLDAFGAVRDSGTRRVSDQDLSSGGRTKVESDKDATTEGVLGEESDWFWERWSCG